MKEKKYREYVSDWKTLLTIVALTLAFIFTLLISFGIELTVNKIENIDTFLTNLAVNFALCVYCLYFGLPEGKNLYQKKENGRYKIAREQFREVRSKVVNKDKEFNQWLEKYYQENKRDYFKEILSLHGNIDIRVLDLDYSELNNLSKPFKKSWEGTEFEGREDTYFRSLNDDQIKCIKAIFEGKIVVEKLPNDFFKTFNGKVINSEYIEQAKANKRNILQTTRLMIYRIIAVFLFALVFAIIGFKESPISGSTEIVGRITTSILRVWTMISSFIYGLSVGKISVVNETISIEYKTRVNNLFLNDKDFKPLNEDELAKIEYEQFNKKEIEKNGE